MNARPGGRASGCPGKLPGRTTPRNPTRAERRRSGREAVDLEQPVGIFLTVAMADSLPPSPTSAPVPAPSASPPYSARERVVERLQASFADDSLSLDEFERRVAAAYQVKSDGELDALVADLAQTSSATAVPAYGRIVTILSNNERNGAMPIPRRLEIVSIMGNVELDISGATFAPGLTEIEISAVFGNVELTVPLGMRVESAGDAFVGNFDCKVPNVYDSAGDAERVLRITGHAVFSSVEIRAAPSTLGGLPSVTDAKPRPDDAPRRLS